MIIEINKVAENAAIELYNQDSDAFLNSNLGPQILGINDVNTLRDKAIELYAFTGKGTAIVKKSVQDLSDNYEKFTQKVDKNASNARKIKKKKSEQGADSKCATFGLKEVLTLLKNNGLPTDPDATTLDDYKLRIYFGQHDKATVIKGPEGDISIKDDYDRQLTVILVAAEIGTDGKFVDKLTPKQGANPSIAIPLGTALEVATLCPPSCNDEGIGID